MYIIILTLCLKINIYYSMQKVCNANLYIQCSCCASLACCPGRMSELLGVNPSFGSVGIRLIRWELYSWSVLPAILGIHTTWSTYDVTRGHYYVSICVTPPSNIFIVHISFDHVSSCCQWMNVQGEPDDALQATPYTLVLCFGISVHRWSWQSSSDLTFIIIAD